MTRQRSKLACVPAAGSASRCSDQSLSSLITNHITTKINAILDNGDLAAAGFSNTERSALDVTTELCSTHRLRDDTFAAAQAVFGDEALTELLMIISCYYGLALVLNATDLDVDSTARFQP